MSTSKPHLTPSTSGHTPSTQESLSHAIYANGGVPRIETALRQRLDESGWTQALREYTLALLRNGECRSFDEVKARVDGLVRLEGEGEGEGKAGKVVNGESGGVKVPDLSVGREVQEGCVTVVRRELEMVCEVER